MATHQATQDYVTARHAADLCRVSERTVRRHIASGKLPAERLPDGDFAIPVSALATLRKAAKERAHRRGDLPAEVASLRAEVEQMRATVEALQGRLDTADADKVRRRAYLAPPPTHTGQQDALTDDAGQSPRSVRFASQRATGAYHPFAMNTGVTTHADMGRWLVRHGIASETTPKSWPGWRETPPTPADVLALAISLADAGNWRKSWRLHPCDDPGCVCQTMLGQAASE